MPKTPEHEVKVRFTREFADVGPVVTCSVPESLSSASSFHSLSSTLSTKSSSGICPDSSFDTPDDIAANTSYVNTNIPGVEDLILACADIHLGNEQVYESTSNVSQDLNHSQDQTFASATDESQLHTSDCFLNESLSRPDAAVTDEAQVIETQPHIPTHALLNQTSESNSALPLGDKQPVRPTEKHASQTKELPEKLDPPQESDDTTSETETHSITSSTVKDSSVASNAGGVDQLDVTVTVSPDNSFASVATVNEEQTVESSHSAETLSLEDFESCATHISAPSTSEFLSTQHTEGLYSSPLESINKETKNDSAHDLSDSVKGVSASPVLSLAVDTDQKLLTPIAVNSSNVQTENSEVVEELYSPRLNKQENSTKLLSETDTTEPGTLDIRRNPHTSLDTQDSAVRNSAVLNETQTFVPTENIAVCNETLVVEQRKLSEVSAVAKEKSVDESLDRTLTLQQVDVDFAAALSDDQYIDFKPQRQSTTLVLPKEEPNFEDLKSTAEKVSNELFNSSLEFPEETDKFVSATSTSECTNHVLL